MATYSKKHNQTITSFGNWHFDSHLKTLASNTRTTNLNRTQYTLLTYFLQHPNTVISKHQLFDILWPEGNANLDAVKVAISDMRKLLQDSTQSPHYIQTDARRGYRWIAAEIQPKNKSFAATTNILLAASLIIIIFAISLVVFNLPNKVPQPNLYTRLNASMALKNITNIHLNQTKTTIAYFKNDISSQTNQLYIDSLMSDLRLTINHAVSVQWHEKSELLAILHKRENTRCGVTIFSESSHSIVQNIACPPISNTDVDKLSITWLPHSTGLLLLSGSQTSTADIWRYNVSRQQWNIANALVIPEQADTLQFVSGYSKQHVTVVAKNSATLKSTFYQIDYDDYSNVTALPFSINVKDQSIIERHLFYIDNQNKLMSLNIDSPSEPLAHHIILEKSHEISAISDSQLLLNYYDLPAQRVFLQLAENSQRIDFQVDKIRLPKVIDNLLFFIGGNNNNQSLMVADQSGFQSFITISGLDSSNIIDFDVVENNALIVTADTLYLGKGSININKARILEKHTFTSARLLKASDDLLISFCMTSQLSAEHQCGTIDPRTMVSAVYLSLPNDKDVDYFLSPDANYLLTISGTVAKLLSIPTTDTDIWFSAAQSIAKNQIAEINWAQLYRETHSYNNHQKRNHNNDIKLSDSGGRFPKLNIQSSTLFAAPIIIDIE